MKRFMLLCFLLGFFFVVFTANAEIVFEDNFDGHSDWTSPEQALSTGSDRSYSDGSATQACSICPDGDKKYAGFYNQRAAWPDFRGEPLAKIDSTDARSGKSLKFWHEPIDTSSCDGGTYWCSGGVLSLLLPSSYDDLYVRFFIKFQNGWAWDDDPNSGALQKFLRVSNYHNPPGSLFTYGASPSGSHHPMVFWDIGYWLNAGGGDNFFNVFSPRYTSTYNPAMATPAGFYNEDISTHSNWANYLGDGQWHSIEMHVKGNTAGGFYPGTPNGEWDFWIDGELSYHKTNMAWADAADSDNYWSPSIFPGWNHVALGGNAFNKVYPVSSHTEQWYAVDDFVVSTTYIGPDYIIGGGTPTPTPDTTPPSIPTGIVIQ